MEWALKLKHQINYKNTTKKADMTGRGQVAAAVVCVRKRDRGPLNISNQLPNNYSNRRHSALFYEYQTS